MSDLKERLQRHARFKTIGFDSRDLLEQALARIAELEAQLKAAHVALKAYETAIDEAEAIFGGEYSDHYGPMFDLAMKARDARRVALDPKPTATGETP